MRIGIDVGGTNTDAVIMDGSKVIASVKRPTSDDITVDVKQALTALQEKQSFNPSTIAAVMIGTTHFINALIEAKRLTPTAALRLGLPATSALPPEVDWPPHLVNAIGSHVYLAHGGHEYDGRVISDLDEAELKNIADQMGVSGVRSVAISSVFSPVNNEFEQRAAEIITDYLGDEVAVSLSHEIGRIGLLERENATIINAALRELAASVTQGIVKTIAGYGITAPLFLSQNDGTLMDLDFARRYPVATFASGPTNSMRGAAVLSGMTDCAVVDVGGTTSDIGVLIHGFPREATTAVTVAGVHTNFRMPDVLSIGIGGGSRVSPDGTEVGPDSVGFRLLEQARVFGGETLTATDIVVAAGMADVGDKSLVKNLDRSIIDNAVARIGRDVTEVIEQMRTSSADLPVVAVGGGSILIPDVLEGFGTVHRPDHFEVANAIGAAIAQVGGQVDRVYNIGAGEREQVVEQARAEATEQAVGAGADPDSIEIVEYDEVPLPYLPGGATRIRCKAVGSLTLTNSSGA